MNVYRIHLKKITREISEIVSEEILAINNGIYIEVISGKTSG